jgi:hypothetical protein
MAQGKKTPTHIKLAPGDAAFIIRGNGETEMIVPATDADAIVPTTHLMLTAFAIGFEDERLRDVLAKIIEERRAEKP